MTSKIFGSTARELREAIAKAKDGRRNKAVPGKLRARALDLAEAGQAQGTTTRRTAAALGVHETTLANWRRGSTSRNAFVPARMVVEQDAEREVGGLSSVGPIRVTIVDGLDAATLATLLRGSR
jgi:hypothetical protein